MDGWPGVVNVAWMVDNALTSFVLSPTELGWVGLVWVGRLAGWQGW